MKKIISIYDYLTGRSTDRIVGSLNRMVNRLDAHAQRQSHKQQRKVIKAAQLAARSQAHGDEAAKAKNVRAKIADLIG